MKLLAFSFVALAVMVAITALTGCRIIYYSFPCKDYDIVVVDTKCADSGIYLNTCRKINSDKTLDEANKGYILKTQ